MSKNLVIVESPAKAKTIERILGKDFVVKSSMGHVRDLPQKNIGIDITNQFEPNYEILSNKTKIINELKTEVKRADTIWLATDEDREGEAISWHLMEVLGIGKDKSKRIVFHEITQTAIVHAIEHPRDLNIDLVNAQQARRVLDRLVGFELSPLLWKKVKPSLSAGRVQSVAVRLIVEKEKEIQAFQSTPMFRVVATFTSGNNIVLQAELNTRFKTEKEVDAFLEKCKSAHFTVAAVEKQATKKTPPPPFTTSTLQQEAARKLNFPVARTMMIAQQLYEAGFITYMRTDSVQLSDLALNTTKKYITEEYGKTYSKTRNYRTKSKGAQEAHEAIRPTYIDKASIENGDSGQERLYDLIRKRTLASQMSDAEFERTHISIHLSNAEEKFTAVGEVLLFDGFLKIYTESKDESEEENMLGKLPSIHQGAELYKQEIQAVEKYSQAPYRYTEASLVRKLEELGIGRPSTYAPIISTIQKRQYVVKGNKEGFERPYKVMTLTSDNTVKKTVKKEKVGYDKAKLMPTDIGNIVNNFLMEYFKEIMNYNFTAGVEMKFDEIAEGKLAWKEMIHDFYYPFHEKIESTLKNSEKAKGERLLGIDPTSGKNVYAKLARYGAVVQIGDTKTDEKLKFSKLLPGQSIETITLEEALELFKLPRTVGTYEGDELIVNIGPYGPYVLYKKKYYSVPKQEDLFSITVERCVEIIAEKTKKDEAKKPVVIGKYKDVEVSAAVGRYGPYIAYSGHFYKLSANTIPADVKLQDAIDIIQQTDKKNTVKSFTEDKDLKIMKAKTGKYIAYKNATYKIPRTQINMDLSYEDCMKIIQTALQKKK